MGTSSARPSALRAFARTAHAIDHDTLAPRDQPLRSALDAFRSSPGWSDFLSDVPPLDIDYGAARGRLTQIADYVDQVAAGFEAADPDPRSDGVIWTGDETLAPHITIRLDSPVNLVQDGDRWIFSGTDDRDFVRVVTRDGHTFLEVGVVFVGSDGRRHIRWESRQLTDAQARNLVLRTGDGEDFVGVSPDVNVRVTVWTGEGNDAVGTPGRSYSSRLGGAGADLIFTGAGNDRVEGGAGDDEIYGGDGNDFIDGQGGNDRVVGGDGGDVLYGGSGSDRIDGGAGDDYLEGGSDNDVLRGNGGRDLLSGGRGDDDLHGGAGSDDLFGGRGTDNIEGGDDLAANDTDGPDHDKVTADSHDRIGGTETYVHIELDGEPGSTAIDLGNKPDWMTDAEWDAWRERVDSDLEFLRTTHAGRQSLLALDQASRGSDSGWNPFDGDRRITILPYAPYDGDNHPRPASFDQYAEALLNNDQLPGENPNHAGHVDSLNRFDRSYQTGDDLVYGHTNVADFSFGPPSLTLQHELSHGFDSLHGGVSDGGSGWNPFDGHENYTEIRRDRNGHELGRADVPRDEVNSVGLDVDGNGDPDTIETGDGTEHPDYFTENALRRELRRPWRDSYTMGTQDGRQNGEHVTYENAD
jgi:NleD-like pathogen effector protein (putative zinc metallopeptidase)/hemolysin type calcium-binding protein